MNNEKLIRKFDRQARMYEIRRKKLSEKEWRSKLIGNAQGSVLEVAVGAGANFQFYPKNVEVTAVDFSGVMLGKAKDAAADSGIRADFHRSDVESLSFPDGSFDTIVSTLSFCGYEDPLGVLRKFRRWCKPDGRILLMEHGLGSNRAIRGLQNVIDPLFRKAVGCHCNRNILRILEESGVRIDRMERHFMGAVYLVWASPGE